MARIDDRLIHGQVVLGCCGPLGVRRLVLCSDEVVADPMQRRVYGAAVPPEIEVEFHSLREGAHRLLRLEADGELEATLVVVGSCADMGELVELGAPIATVTIGGLHHRPGTEERWPGFFVDEHDLRGLRRLRRHGVRLELQTVPGSRSVELGPEFDPDAPGSA